MAHPEVVRHNPMSLLVSAFSIDPNALRSQGCTTMRCASGVLMPAIWLSGVAVP